MVRQETSTDDLEQSSFASAIRTNYPDPISGLENVTESCDQVFPAIRFGDFMKLQDFLSHSTRSNRDIELGAGNFFWLGHQLGSLVQTRFRLACPRFCATSQPC